MAVFKSSFQLWCWNKGSCHDSGCYVGKDFITFKTNDIAEARQFLDECSKLPGFEESLFEVHLVQLHYDIIAESNHG